jgi:hypothetical protein
MGVDISSPLLALARSRGVAVLQRSIFDRVPAAGRWGTVLLLDGNVGIGGDPVMLLNRVRALVKPGGFVLLEFDPPGRGVVPSLARIDLDGQPGPWFGWARVGACQAADLLARCPGLRLADRWSDEGRWFASVERT